MSAFTKEQLIARAETVLSNARTAADFHGSKPYHMMDVHLAEIALASLTAEPVLYAAEETLAYAKMGEPLLKCLSQPTGDAVIPLYTAPPAPVSAPDFGALTKCIVQRLVDYGTADDEAIASAEEFVYSACRAAMLQGVEPVSQRPELTVWYGSMPESNGKTNWTAILHRKGEGRCFDGFTIDCSEYPGRVLYAADRVRYLIGEKAERPHILDYDGEEHSGYVWPRTKEGAAVETLESKGYTWHGGELWKPPLGKAPAYITGEQTRSELLQRAEKLADDAEALAERVSRGDTPRPYLTGCAAGRDGECSDPRCPQLRDNEPGRSGRHCPLDAGEDEDA